MSLKFKITKAEWEGLDEGIKGLYEEKDGEYALGVEGIEDTSGLKSALAKERSEREKYAKQAKAWETLGKTPEEIQELVAQQAEAEKKRLEKAGEFDKLKQQLIEQHSTALAAKDKELVNMKGSLESYLIDANAIAAITKNEGNTTLLLPHVKSRVRVINEDNKYKVQVVLQDGQTPMLNDKAEPISIEDFVKSMRNDETFQVAFKPTGTTGSGSEGSKGGQAGSSQFKITRAEMSANVRKYIAIKEAAAKANQEVEIID